MSTPDKPDAPQLTRRQLRELRNTASTPVITPEDLTASEPAEPVPVVAPLARAAEPAVVAEEPPAPEDVDLSAPALTRRSARRQERLRTASVPIIDEGSAPEAAGERPDDRDAVPPRSEDAEAVGPDEADASGHDAAEAVLAPDVDGDAEAPAEPTDAHDGDVATAAPADADQPSEQDAVAEAESVADELAEAQSEAPDVEVSTTDAEAPRRAADAGVVDETTDEDERAVVAPTFGSGLLSGEGVEIEMPASFDQLLHRGSAATGAMTASNALILSQTPDTGAFSSPVTATGEVIITGTFNLPESLGSAGTTQGSSDGKDIDAILVDGELPASSSPTPIAASAAISTIKSAEDIIKPPAPEKGGRLMLALVITAGALALALTGALIVALVTGVFR